MNPAPPRLQGASKVHFKLKHGQGAEVDGQLRFLEKAWQGAHEKLKGAGGLCGCGSRWPHLMNGIEVTLVDKAPYTARCWDDDRLFIHLKKFAQEKEGGVGVLVHEFGHRVWFQCLDNEKRDIWKQSFLGIKKRSSRRGNSCGGTACGGFVSEYAGTDELEDFADTFRILVDGKLDKSNQSRWRDVCACRDRRCSMEPAAANMLRTTRRGVSYF